MARVIKPPAPIALADGEPALFLAGSIGMGGASEWQREVERALAGARVTLLNPRRDAWDSSWAQSIDNPPFREQVEWELEGQERADLILMYFDPQTQAPITLLELGLAARGGRLVVCCPEGFWRRGNVEVVCARYGIPTAPDLAGLVGLARARLRI